MSLVYLFLNKDTSTGTVRKKVRKIKHSHLNVNISLMQVVQIDREKIKLLEVILDNTVYVYMYRIEVFIHKFNSIRHLKSQSYWYLIKFLQ